ncbi:helix-turn-helix domain-containing protein [Candidatus Dojkabacteria bacterium]|uniref:Helix-turn-helix domain-containing protein n=1 Tax=Candidatus Dojkabacteria bacterium TaxID=2099670 RepID=A0A955I782_9BACT|nr:helix-turn-helix domain-containing protein [Candidatus Dojkabacteria bacterium]
MIKTAFELKTVGKLLAEKRMAKKLTYDEISEIVKINPEYLEALENAEYSKFPSEVYVKGFLRNYSKFLNIDPEHALALYRREREKAMSKPKLGVGEKIKSSKFNFSLSSGKVIGFIALFISLITVFYVGNYVFDIFQSPTLELKKPVEINANESGNFVTEEDSVQLEGISEIGNKLSINGQEYRVNSFEQFTVDLRLEEGLNEIRISSQNQINRSSEIVLNVLYNKTEPEAVSVNPEVTEDGQVNINYPIVAKIEVTGQGAYLEAKVDGVLQASKAYPVNEVVIFNSQETFELYIPRYESINLFINEELQALTNPRVKFSLIDGKVSKINP